MAGLFLPIPYPTLWLLSAIALAYEIVLLRMFSIIQWHHFAFMVISLALLGYSAGGTFVVLLKKRLGTDALRVWFSPLSFINAILFSFSMWFCFQFTQSLEINPQELLWHWGQWFTLAAIYLTLAIPFLFISNCVVLAFTCFPVRAGRIYAADLLGAGAGSLFILYLLHTRSVEQSLETLVWLSLFASAGYMIGFTQHRRAASLTLVSRLLPWLAVALLILHFMPGAAYVLPVAVKVTISLLLIAPVAFFMGLPMPLAIRQFRQSNDDLIAWAWTVNGAASVLSAVLATLLAMEFGYRIVLGLAALLYLLGLYVFPSSPNTPVADSGN